MSLSRAVHRSLFNQQHLPLLIGLCVGIVLSLLFTPQVGDGCQQGTLESSNIFSKNLENFRIANDPTSQQEKDDSNDYEPRINLLGKPQSAKKEPQNTFVRPRHFSTELGIKEKCFVAVLSSLKQIPTLGVAINETLAHHVNRLAFFVDVSYNENLEVKTLPIVGFRDGQQGFLTLHTLKYLADKLQQNYNYFFLIKDTSFVNGRNLAKFINHISITNHVYMGSVVNDQLFSSSVCSLDSGILISSSVLSALAPVLEKCTEDFAFNPEDEKVGLCIHKALNLTCQTQLQGQYFSSLHLEEQHVTSIHHLEEFWNSNPRLHSALTIYPSRDPTHFYLLNKLSCTFALNEVAEDIGELEKSILRLAPRAPGGLDSITWPIGYSSGARTDTRFDILRWEYFNTSHIFLHTEQSVVDPLTKIDRYDIQDVIDSSVSYVLKHNPNYSYIRLVNGYRRFDPTRGMDYILDILFETGEIHGEKDTMLRLQACRPITHIETVPMPYVTESSRVNIVVPVLHPKDVPAAIKFINAFSKILQTKSEDAHLTVIIFYPPSSVEDEETDVFAELTKLIQSFRSQAKKDESKIDMAIFRFSTVPMLDIDIPLDIAIVDLINSNKEFGPETLVLLCYPHSEIHSDFLNRVRINTISGWQLYSPIPFAEYNPDVTRLGTKDHELNVSTSQGFYNSHDTWHISFYMADYLNARKTFELELPMMKSEKDFLDQHKSPYRSMLSMFTRLHRLHVLRAVEPQLRLRYHPRTENCFDHPCQESLLLSQGTRSQLVKLLYDQELHKPT